MNKKTNYNKLINYLKEMCNNKFFFNFLMYSVMIIGTLLSMTIIVLPLILVFKFNNWWLVLVYIPMIAFFSACTEESSQR